MVKAAESKPGYRHPIQDGDQWKETREQVKAFLNTRNSGNITVFDGGKRNKGKFLEHIGKTVAQV